MHKIKSSKCIALLEINQPCYRETCRPPPSSKVDHSLPPPKQCSEPYVIFYGFKKKFLPTKFSFYMFLGAALTKKKFPIFFL